MAVVNQKMRSNSLTTVFNWFANDWVCNNALNYCKAKDCFKIITCDPVDDTIG